MNKPRVRILDVKKAAGAGNGPREPLLRTSLSESSRGTQIRTRECPSRFCCVERCSNQPIDPDCAAVWRVLCPPQGYLLQRAPASLKPPPCFKSVILPSTHSSSSCFSLCHFHCLHTLAWFTKSSAQQQGHNHLSASILANTLKRGKLLLFLLDLFWKCHGFMAAQLQLKCTLSSMEGSTFESVP